MKGYRLIDFSIFDLNFMKIRHSDFAVKTYKSIARHYRDAQFWFRHNLKNRLTSTETFGFLSERKTTQLRRMAMRRTEIISVDSVAALAGAKSGQPPGCPRPVSSASRNHSADCCARLLKQDIRA